MNTVWFGNSSCLLQHIGKPRGSKTFGRAWECDCSKATVSSWEVYWGHTWVLFALAFLQRRYRCLWDAWHFPFVSKPDLLKHREMTIAGHCICTAEPGITKISPFMCKHLLPYPTPFICLVSKYRFPICSFFMTVCLVSILFFTA